MSLWGEWSTCDWSTGHWSTCQMKRSRSCLTGCELMISTDDLTQAKECNDQQCPGKNFNHQFWSIRTQTINNTVADQLVIWSELKSNYSFIFCWQNCPYELGHNHQPINDQIIHDSNSYKPKLLLHQNLIEIHAQVGAKDTYKKE